MKKLFYFISTITILLVFILPSFSQKKRRAAKPKPVERIMTAPPIAVQPTDANCQPSEEPAMIVISESGNISLGEKQIKKTDIPQELANFYCGKLLFDQVVYIKADENTQYDQIAEVLKYTRKLDYLDDVVLMLDSETKIETGGLKVPAEEDEEPSNKKVKAHSLLLTIAILPDGKTELNGKPQTVESIKQLLGQTFETRKKKRIYIEGSLEVEKTVFIYGQSQTKFGEIVKIIKEIEKTGAFPIGLDIDDYYLNVVF